jgi:alkylhydroperoxidase/carboxymuconolactone decarboxylase family protein YurZ
MIMSPSIAPSMNVDPSFIPLPDFHELHVDLGEDKELHHIWSTSDVLDRKTGEMYTLTVTHNVRDEGHLVLKGGDGAIRAVGEVIPGG